MEEERVLAEEWDVSKEMKAPDSRKCFNILQCHPNVFINRTKTDIQDKPRRTIKKKHK